MTGTGTNSETIKSTYARIADLGKSAASGSVMEVAQCASRYHYDPDLARGMYLYEHYRCYDEIVSYCNALCYHNKLQPKRGRSDHPDRQSSALPAMGYLHIDGKCERMGGSRVNEIEAVVIADWIASKTWELESRYGKPIHEIVGVLTPFGSQVGAISKVCMARGIAVGTHGLTVGTVHSLQGAARDVVLFSGTYTTGADGRFIDRSTSMLNVAVSRAKDSFLVFGDMALFKTAPKSSSRGLLGTFLFDSTVNGL